MKGFSNRERAIKAFKKRRKGKQGRYYMITFFINNKDLQKQYDQGYYYENQNQDFNDNQDQNLVLNISHAFQIAKFDQQKHEIQTRYESLSVLMEKRKDQKNRKKLSQEDFKALRNYDYIQNQYLKLNPCLLYRIFNINDKAGDILYKKFQKQRQKYNQILPEFQDKKKDQLYILDKKSLQSEDYYNSISNYVQAQKYFKRIKTPHLKFKAQIHQIAILFNLKNNNKTQFYQKINNINDEYIEKILKSNKQQPQNESKEEAYYAKAFKILAYVLQNKPSLKTNKQSIQKIQNLCLQINNYLETNKKDGIKIYQDILLIKAFIYEKTNKPEMKKQAKNTISSVINFISSCDINDNLIYALKKKQILMRHQNISQDRYQPKTLQEIQQKVQRYTLYVKDAKRLNPCGIKLPLSKRQYE